MKIILTLLLMLTAFLFNKNIYAQNPENWTARQLMEPSELAGILKSNSAFPMIFSVGPAATIPHSIEIGMVKDKVNLEKFKQQLSSLPKYTKIIIYCGCCPFDHCPNVRPAIEVLKEMKFTNYYLLDLSQNIKKDWIDKGYPTVN